MGIVNRLVVSSLSFCETQGTKFVVSLCKENPYWSDCIPEPKSRSRISLVVGLSFGSDLRQSIQSSKKPSGHPGLAIFLTSSESIANVGACLLKVWYFTENNPQGEYVSRKIEFLSQQNFGRHVGIGAAKVSLLNSSGLRAAIRAKPKSVILR